MAEHPIRTALPRIGVRGRLRGSTATAHPAALLIVLDYAAAWVLLDRESLDRHGARDAGHPPASRGQALADDAVHPSAPSTVTRGRSRAKLDELLKANRDAENAVTRVDEKEPEEIEDFRKGQRRGI